MLQEFLYGIPQDVAELYRGKNLLWQIFAASLTAVLVFSGADWWYYTVTRSALLYPFILLAGLGGFIVPVVSPLALYFAGSIAQSVRLRLMGVAIMQSELIASLITALYKAVTGRLQPEVFAVGTTDISHAFQFGFLQNGIFWGWPSSHASVAFAGAITIMLLIKSPLVRFFSLLYAVLVAFGASTGFHWLSDVLAGVIIGTLAARVVAKRFESKIVIETSQ